MALPPQIERRLATLGVQAAEIDERFVRPQKINKTGSTV